MNDIFENTKTMKENDHPRFTPQNPSCAGIPTSCATSLPTACWTPVCSMIPPAAWPVR